MGYFGRRLGAIIALVLALAGPGLSAGPDSIIGIWDRPAMGTRVQIHRCGDKLCGKIIRLLDHSQRDINNADPRLRLRLLVGVPMFMGLAHSAGAWRGKLYLPEDGKTYKVKIFVLNSDKITVRSCAFMHFFCTTETWTKVN
ncbi:MAG: DUF2147 domain-containing protein [Hyphomicrobiaceae bacterium]|nr:MAG: DUF2147 domain-containing protein [Hyphomicrobiaceae bacterium]